MMNLIIKQEKDLTEIQADKLSRTEYESFKAKTKYGEEKYPRRSHPECMNGYVLIKQPDTYDLYIVTCGIIRRCQGMEWGDYFRNYLTH